MNETELLWAALDCWCTALAESRGGSPANCCVIAGPPVVTDCCAGFAWARLLSSYPSVAFPSPDFEARRCSMGTYAMVLELGIIRCAASGCGQAGVTCCESEAEAALIQLDDYRAMRKALTCGCLNLQGDQIILGTWDNTPPSGLCVQSSMTATLQWFDRG